MNFKSVKLQQNLTKVKFLSIIWGVLIKLFAKNSNTGKFPSRPKIKWRNFKIYALSLI